MFIGGVTPSAEATKGMEGKGESECERCMGFVGIAWFYGFTDF